MFSSRYDYENIDIDAACEMMEDLEIVITEKSFLKQRFAVEDKIYQVEKADNFEYTDPIDSTISRNQVWNATVCCYGAIISVERMESAMTFFCAGVVSTAGTEDYLLRWLANNLPTQWDRKGRGHRKNLHRQPWKEDDLWKHAGSYENVTTRQKKCIIYLNV